MLNNNSPAISKNEYPGVDFQIAAKWLLGTSQLSAEYLHGTLSGTNSSNQIPCTAPIDKSNMPIPSFIRSFHGGYLLFTQDILKTNLQLIFKHDWFDPNSKVSGSEIGILPYTRNADIKIAQLG